MKTSGKNIVIVILFLCFVIILALFWNFYPFSKKTDTYENNKPKKLERDELNQRSSTSAINKQGDESKSNEEEYLNYYNSEIKLYGKVVDQHGNPVANAIIDIYPVSDPDPNGSTKSSSTTANKSGEFYIDGLKGYALGVRARKNGYIEIPPLAKIASSRNLTYSGAESNGKLYSSRESQLVLNLLKVESDIPIIHGKKRRWNLPIDGTTESITLDDENGAISHKIDFTLKSDWPSLPKDNFINTKQFDWSLSISIPGGGLVWNETDINSIAPESDYKESVSCSFKASMLPAEWKRSCKGRFFVRFKDGTYGRIHFTVDGATDRGSLYMETWLSSVPNSNNLTTEDITIKVVEPIKGDSFK